MTTVELMMNLSEHAGMRPYTGVDDIMAVKHFSLAHERDVMERFGTILNDSGMADVLGIALLHTHFELHDNEILVEAISENEAISTPEQVTSLAEPVYPIIWHLQNDGDFRPLHWRRGVQPGGGDIGFFLNCPQANELAFSLEAHKNRFGIILKSELEANLNENELLMEYSYTDERVLRSVRVKNSEHLDGTKIETAWYFSNALLQAGRSCDQYTRKVCTTARVCEQKYWPGPDGGYSHNVHDRHIQKKKSFHDRVSR